MEFLIKDKATNVTIVVVIKISQEYNPFPIKLENTKPVNLTVNNHDFMNVKFLKKIKHQIHTTCRVQCDSM